MGRHTRDVKKRMSEEHKSEKLFDKLVAELLLLPRLEAYLEREKRYGREFRFIPIKEL